MIRRRAGSPRARVPALARPIAALAVVLAFLGSGPASGLAPAGAVAPSRVQVVAMEYYFILSRHTVAAGPAIVQLVDFGQDPHDLRLQRVGGGRIYGTPVVQPGGLFNLSVDLRPGTYELWCSIADHRKLGMQAQLVVAARA